MNSSGAFPGTIRYVPAPGVVPAVPPGVAGLYHRSTVTLVVVLAVMTPYTDPTTTMRPTCAPEVRPEAVKPVLVGDVMVPVTPAPPPPIIAACESFPLLTFMSGSALQSSGDALGAERGVGGVVGVRDRAAVVRGQGLGQLRRARPHPCRGGVVGGVRRPDAGRGAVGVGDGAD